MYDGFYYNKQLFNGEGSATIVLYTYTESVEEKKKGRNEEGKKTGLDLNCPS